MKSHRCCRAGERGAIGGVAVEDGEDAMAEAQRAAKESLTARQKPKEMTDRYISEKEYVDMFDVVGREVATPPRDTDPQEQFLGPK